jgi:transcriptional regulator GlxA family with amidase domain
VIFEGSDLMDFAGPVSVFHCAANQLRLIANDQDLPYRIEPLSIDGGPVNTLEGVAVETERATELADGYFDTIILSGGMVDERSCDPRIVSWIQRNHAKARRVASVCSGAFILARAGLLDGRMATTHWQECEHLQRSFPKIEVRPDALYLQDGKFWTAAGVTSGIDMAMAMVEDDFGRELALTVARRLVVFLKRPGGQSQFSAPLRSQSTDGPLALLLTWIVDNPCEDLRTETLADRANMSLRNFYRAFESATGMTPADWVEMVRLEIARRLLEQSSEHVDQVAFKSGFSTCNTMRKVFARRLGVTPTAYRMRFSRRANMQGQSVDVRPRADALTAHEQLHPAIDAQPTQSR